MKYRINCVILALLIPLSGCVVYTAPQRDRPPAHVHKYSPPPHAPAHGYRHRHDQDVYLQYDGELGVYGVIGFPDIYFTNGLFYRYDGRSVWYKGTRYKGPWRAMSRKHLPPGLLKKYGKKHPGKSKKKKW